MSDLLAEVDEAMRQEKLAKFWNENAALIIAFVLGTIFLTGAFTGYRAWDESVKKSQTTALIKLINNEQYPANIASAELDMRDNLKAVTLLQAAGTMAERDQNEEALKLYTQLSQDTQAPNELRDLATIMSVRLTLNNMEQTQDAQDLLASLEPALNPSRLFWAQAQIEAAGIEAHLNNDYTKAQERLQKIIDAQALPASLYERAKSLHHVYGIKQKEQMSQ